MHAHKEIGTKNIGITFFPASFCTHTKRNSYSLCFQRERNSKYLGSISLTGTYIDDVLSINDPEFEIYPGKMYPTELDNTESITTA